MNLQFLHISNRGRWWKLNSHDESFCYAPNQKLNINHFFARTHSSSLHSIRSSLCRAAPCKSFFSRCNKTFIRSAIPQYVDRFCSLLFRSIDVEEREKLCDQLWRWKSQEWQASACQERSESELIPGKVFKTTRDKILNLSFGLGPQKAGPSCFSLALFNKNHDMIPSPRTGRAGGGAPQKKGQMRCQTNSPHPLCIIQEIFCFLHRRERGWRRGKRHLCDGSTENKENLPSRKRMKCVCVSFLLTLLEKLWPVMNTNKLGCLLLHFTLRRASISWYHVHRAAFRSLRTASKESQDATRPWHQSEKREKSFWSEDVIHHFIPGVRLAWFSLIVSGLAKSKALRRNCCAEAKFPSFLLSHRISDSVTRWKASFAWFSSAFPFVITPIRFYLIMHIVSSSFPSSTYITHRIKLNFGPFFPSAGFQDKLELFFLACENERSVHWINDLRALALILRGVLRT